MFKVAEFVEKPGPELAAEYLATGGFAWNSGIFLLPARLYLEAEWSELGEGKSWKEYVPLTRVELAVPVTFAVLYAVALGVAGSILGRYVPTRYIPKLSGNSSRAPRTRMCTCWVRG